MSAFRNQNLGRVQVEDKLMQAWVSQQRDQVLSGTNEHMPQGREQVYVLLRCYLFTVLSGSPAFMGNVLRPENGHLTQYNHKGIL
jgi:hypothetical protein